MILKGGGFYYKYRRNSSVVEEVAPDLRGLGVMVDLPVNILLHVLEGRGGGLVRELDGLRQLLGGYFELVTTTDLQRICPVNQRNFRVDNNQLSIWKKN